MFCAILLNDTSYDDHHGCQIVVDQIHLLSAAAGVRIIWSSPLRNDWAADAGLLAAAQRADLCLINGEGTLHDDMPAAAQLMQALDYFSSAGLPCFLINALWQNNPSLARYLPRLAGCYLRDELSAQEVKAFRSQAAVVPDLTLGLAGVSESKGRLGLLINGSVLASRQHEAVEQLSLTENATYLSIRTFPPIRLAAHHRAYLLPSLRQRWKHLRHWLSSFRRYPSGSVSGKLMGRFRWRHACLQRKSFLARLASAEGVVTGRFHMVTLCLVTRTPFFAVPSNSHKIEGLLTQLGMDDRIFDGYEQALAQRERLAFSAQELQRIDDFLVDSRALATRMFEEIVETVTRLAVAASK